MATGKYVKFYAKVDEDYIPDVMPSEEASDYLPSTIKPLVDLDVTNGYTVTYGLIMDISQLTIIRNDDKLSSLRETYNKLKNNKEDIVRMEYVVDDKLIAYDDYKNWFDFSYNLMDDGKEKLEVVYLINVNN